MTMTLNKVRGLLSYSGPKPQPALSVDELPHLGTILQADDAFLASQAVWAISKVQDKEAEDLLKKAAQSDKREVRVAVAAITKQLTQPVADEILLTLLSDEDAGVRKWALKAVGDDAAPALREKIETLAADDAVSFIRTLSGDTQRRLPAASE